LSKEKFDQTEKADDAIDYEDFSDDDLPEEELPDEELVGEDTQQLSGTTVEEDFNGKNFGDDDSFDHLFTDHSSPGHERSHQDDVPMASIEDSQLLPDTPSLGQTAIRDGALKGEPTFRLVNYSAPQDEVENKELLEQQRLFGMHHRGEGQPLPAPVQISKEEFVQLWPDFEPGLPLRFWNMVPKPQARFNARAPLKTPKSVQPNKVSLDLAVDQEKAFRLPSSAPTQGARQTEDEQRGIIYIADSVEEEAETSDEMELDAADEWNDHEMIGNTSLNDLKIACEDWDAASLETLSDEESLVTPPGIDMDIDDIRDFARPAKKRRLDQRAETTQLDVQFSVYDRMELPSFDDPELATAKLSKKIILDMNDPHLLLDIQQPSAEQKKPRVAGAEFKRDKSGSLANPIFKRYNISNDEAYDALKENVQQKIRSVIGHMNVEHSLPALKLQYPFYKVNLSDRELRSFHRPTINFKPGERVHIHEVKHTKRKHKKNLKVSEAFAAAEDLNVGDTSDLLLAEYSEEYPTTLSNFGMGSKILNYYRRKDNDDAHRPKLDLGETHVLLPQDKSPFSLFGSVEPGETVPTLHNAMYRAPFFKHDAKETDFLVSRSQTGVHGPKYFLRSIQNLGVVGQEFPSVEVPGTHARKVTEASKKRLKMLSFRLYRKGQQRGLRQPWVSNEMIKHHLPGTEIAQNRSRMREIMKYDKERGTWIPQDGELVPDEPTLRTWIKPEDVCLIDSMHAGDKHLVDSGYKANEIKEDEDAEDGDNTELKLAPWHTTKNFLNACSGKAMLELWGQGDPTGRGEAFSFIKVSMKGGFKDVGESTADKVDALKNKELGGHSYNVARQQRQYEDAINRIWNKQKESLKSTQEHSEMEADADEAAARQAAGQAAGRGRTPRSEIGTPALMRDDDTMSQFSRNSNGDTRNKILKIRRKKANRHGEVEELEPQVITDPEVIKLYVKRKKAERLMNMKLDEIKPTGNAEFDQQQQAKLRAELARLTRNVERREGREKAKGIHVSQTSVPGTPSLPNGGKNAGATPRKCANCGEVGHIKTNKKLCPLLNGQKSKTDTFKDAASAAAAAVAASPVT
ncbi:hypothetical protein BDV96DRAFT_461431, partial [Lophiotrema nucula]